MIAELGHFALILALLVGLVQASVPLVGAHRGNAQMIRLAAPAAFAQFALAALAFFILMHAYIVSDFSIANVAENSNSAKPMLYKIAGTWGNHEGSLMLWVFILTLFGAAVALFGRNLPPALKARVLSVQAMIGVGFLLYMLLTSDPFQRLWPVPADGRGLNPLLQDPGLAFHPPFLYLGYVGFSTAFSFAVAALIEGRVDPAWARWVRPWTLAAWISLTLGIAMGSWWAYYTLGWGGWWYWDPVENASLMPWLVGTALLHSAIVVEKRDALKTWTILLAVVTFSLSLLGTFLVRSGVLTSVHAFATDPRRGMFILILLALAVGASFTLFAIRAPSLKSGGMFAPVSREGALLLNNLLMATAAGTVLLGTLYPLLLDAVGGGKVSVGKPFFNDVFVPLMVPLLAALSVGAMLSWKRADLWAALSRLKIAFVAMLAAAAVVLFATGGKAAMAAMGMALAAWVGVGTLVDLAERLRLFGGARNSLWNRVTRLPRASWGMTLAHLGVALVVAGITGSANWTVQKVQAQKIGETVHFAGFDATLRAVNEVKTPSFTATRADMVLSRNGKVIGVYHPERRFYTVERQTATDTAIRSTPAGDVYMVIGEATEGGYATRYFYNSMVPWLWAGAALMALGGVVSLSDRRYRIGAPLRRRAQAPAMQAAE